MHAASAAFWMMPSALSNTVLLWTVGVSKFLLDAKLFAHFSKPTTIELPAVVRSYNRYLRGYFIGTRVSQKLLKSVPLNPTCASGNTPTRGGSSHPSLP